VIAAWMSGSSGPMSSPVAGAGSGARSPAGSLAGTARASSPGSGSIRFTGAQPVSTSDQAPRATRLPRGWVRPRDRIRPPPLQLLRPAKVGHVKPKRVDGNRLLRGGRDDLSG